LRWQHDVLVHLVLKIPSVCDKKNIEKSIEDNHKVQKIGHFYLVTGIIIEAMLVYSQLGLLGIVRICLL
jgi:hypothetical protein